MDYKTKQQTILREQPSDTAKLVRGLQSQSQLKFLGQKQGEGNDTWINVEFKPPGGLAALKGWVRQADCEEIAEVAAEGVSEEGFVQACILAERRLNVLDSTAPWFVSADFLIARAVIETGITNAGSTVAGSDAVGPLQVSSSEWDAFLKSGPFAEGYSPDGRSNPIIQVNAAACRMNADMKAISKLKTPQPETAEGPYQASNLDIFHAYLFDSPAAAAAIIDVEDDPEKSNQSLKDVLKGALTEDQMKAVFTARSKYTGPFDAPKTVAGLIAETEQALNAAFQKAAALIETHAPEVLPKPREAEAPWFDEAEKAEAAGVNESERKHVQTINDYFLATSLGRVSGMPPWCGAFVAHCMAASGNKDLIPDGAAQAVSWKKFGVGIPAVPGQVPKGAVVVFKKRNPDAGGTGHVAFFSEFINDGNKVRVLGGNQSDAVNRTAYPTSQIAAIRWVETAPPHQEILQSENVKPANLPPGEMEISQDAFKLILEFEVTDQKTYERSLRGPTWPGVKSGITIGIGYDVGHQSQERVRQDCAGILDAGVINRLVKACGTTGPAAKQLLPGLKDINVPWEKALHLYKVNSIPHWTAIVKKHLPNADKLKADSLGALVMLTFNRGPSFSKSGSRYAEMRAIKQHMASGNFARIPAEIRNMKRIWPNVAGLQRRREAEAKLFEQGLR